jgi:hypothetical protein
MARRAAGAQAPATTQRSSLSIATGLERSGHRFLRVVRAPPHDDPEKPFDPRADPDLDALLPAGFLERTGGRGHIVKLSKPEYSISLSEVLLMFFIQNLV